MPLSRRQFLAAAGITGAAAATGYLIEAGSAADHGRYVIDAAHDVDPAGSGSLADVDHFVLLMQENRSFDHYFGTLSGVRGFDDPSPAYRQYGWRAGVGPSPDSYLMPYRLDLRDRPLTDAEIVNDPEHDWRTQHDAWHHGRLDRILSTHVRTDGRAAPAVMGYYTRAELPVHYGLADAFTICDHYFSSVIGPTVPNRLYWMTATLDPDGRAGGPILNLIHNQPSWRTFPENLRDAGVTWKVYNAPGTRDRALSGTVGRFAQYQDPGSELYLRGVAPTYPADFLADLSAGTLPAVSWLIPSMPQSEHPSYPPAVGAAEIVRVLAALVAHPAIWERTALIISYDENGGLFDHVPPPVPFPGTAQEFVSHHGRTEPIGLGFRVPCLVISPYTRGGLVNSTVLDHTSQLRLLGARFDVPVPNLSSWRAAVVDDLVSTFRQRRPAPGTTPRFPDAAAAAVDAVEDDGFPHRRFFGSTPYLVPPNAMPRQEREPARRRITA